MYIQIIKFDSWVPYAHSWNFFQNMKKAKKNKEECSFVVFGNYVPAVVVLGPVSSSRNFPVKSISWFCKRNKAVAF